MDCPALVSIMAIVLAVVLAGAPAKPPSCIVVAAYALVYGEEAVVQWAKSKGYSDAQIAATKTRCEKYIRK